MNNTTTDIHNKEHDGLGLYATKAQSDPEVKLTPRDDGTFLFPPTSYKDEADYVSFWSNVPISDGVLSNITAGYAELIRKQLNAEKVPWGHRYDHEHAKDLHEGTEQQKDAARYRRSVEYEKFRLEWHKTYPERIKANSARAIARAGQIYYFATALSEEDRAVVRSSTLAVGDVDLTITEVVDRYQLRKLRPNFQDPEVTAAERLEDLRQELQRMQQD